MFTISAETHFWASHQLRASDGSKEVAHYHNWSVTADVSSSKLNNLGLVMDFNQLKSLLCSIASEYDNKTLDDTDYFKKNNPSAENVAKYIYDKLRTKLPKGVKLRSVRVVEEPGCSVIFTGEKQTKKK